MGAGGVEDDLDLLEEDGDGLGEGVGEADGDEGPNHDHPAPPTLGRGVPNGSPHGRRHGSSAAVLTHAGRRNAGLQGHRNTDILVSNTHKKKHEMGR